MRRTLVIILALILDLALGDPPNRWHPVAWMGRGVAWAQRRAPGPKAPRGRAFAYGAGIALAGAGLASGLGLVLARAARALAWPGLLLEALSLKSTLSLRGLMLAARQVETALLAGDLPQARHWLSWHLVSRDASRLDSSQIAAATIESVAENASDGVIAPLFWYALAGLPAALAYRFLNTADAMLGYRDPAREWLGKAPARLDDAVNLLPARFTAFALLLAAWLAGEDPVRAWRVGRRDATKTESPNAGHPMAAMAGALGVRLAKPGHYILGEELRAPGPQDIARSRRVAALAALLAVIALALKAVSKSALAALEP